MVLVNISHAQPSEHASTPVHEAALQVPAYSQWFRFGEVHDIERRALPEFFASDAAKTPTLYCEYRDLMVNTYRLRPKDYLSITTCRRHLTGDVGAIVRVHAFLEQWGLVNAQCDTQLQVGKGMDLHKALAPKVVASVPANLAAFGSVQASILCGVCGVDCSKAYYSSIKEGKSAAVCPLCYGDGRYPIDMMAADFLKYDASAATHRVWSEADTAALLTAVEATFADEQVDWDAIATSLGRAKDQCIWHFLRLPIVETLEKSASMSMSMDTHTDTTEATIDTSMPMAGFPFSQTENPVMSTVTFLASLVHPKVAAAAAQAALREMCEKGDELLGDSMQPIAATALGCAAARAAQLVHDEKHRFAKLHEALVDLQLQKLRVKLALYEDLEKSLEEERKDLEQQRLQLFFERFNMRKRMMQGGSSREEGRAEPMDVEPAPSEEAASLAPKVLTHLVQK